MNHYYKLLLQINNLIDDHKFSDALEIIDKELLMPYVPENIEKELILERNKISAVLMNKTINKTVSMKQYTEEDILNYLQSHNYQVVSSILQYLSRINLRSVILAVKQALVHENISTDIKKVLIKICLNQGISDELKVSIHGKDHHIKMGDLVWIESDDKYKAILKDIYEDVYSNSPQLYSVAESCLIKYFLKFWPLQQEITKMNNNDLKNKIIKEAKDLFK